MVELNFQFSKENASKSVAQHALFSAMQTAKPFNIRKGEDFTLTGTKELENDAWLTSLEIKLDETHRIVFDEVLMSVTQERNIVTTPLQGRDGTIKEFISNGDYNITVDAAVMEGEAAVNEDDEMSFKIPNHVYPQKDLKKLREILTSPQAVAVHSEFLHVFGITSAVVKSFSLTQETHSNRQSIQIQMLSDLPYEIKTIQGDHVKVK